MGLAFFFLADLDSQMDVVGHKAEGVDTMTESLHTFIKKLLETAPVSLASTGQFSAS